MDNALKSLPRQSIPEVLVGYEHSDDAGVFLLTPDIALVQTVDFFAPIVDDAYTFGLIAAANALSDVYAMGGIPRTALSIVGFPVKTVDGAVLGEIMRGGLAKLNEAGVALLGGHSVRDDEIKFGYAITGTIAVPNIKQNKNARPGDRILLTKPLGTGLITTALKRGQAADDHVRRAIEVMSTLNRKASEISLGFRVHAMTDVTGFGLVGHAFEVAKASNICIQIDHARLPILPGALSYSQAGYVAGGLNSNRDYYSQHVRIEGTIEPAFLNLVYDPQTSGGLLIFVEAGDVQSLLSALHSGGVEATEIGVVLEDSAQRLLIV